MHKKLLSILALTILVTSTLVGCSGASPDDSTLTILSITEGTVLVMKAGTDEWTEATLEMTLEVGDTIKTGGDSGAEITFFDGSTIELEAGTQIRITSLDSSPDTGTKTITLMQTIGTTISRVTKLLDPASTYAIETPSGVAAVRGTTLIVRIVSGDPNYPDGTVLITCAEGDIWVTWNGVELHIPEGYTCAISSDGLLELIPPNEPPQEESGDGTGEDTSGGEDEDQQPGGPPTDGLPEPPFHLPDIVIPPPNGDETPPPDGETTATIGVTLDQGNEGWIFIWDVDAGDYAIDQKTGDPVDGTHHETYGETHNVIVAGDRHYYVWVEDGVPYYVKNPQTLPDGWTNSDLPGGGEKADGYAYEDGYTFHFTSNQETAED